MIEMIWIWNIHVDKIVLKGSRRSGFITAGKLFNWSDCFVSEIYSILQNILQRQPQHQW